MTSSKLSLVLIILIFLVSCSKEEPNIQNIKKKSQELEMTAAYEEGLEKLRNFDTYNAAQKFLEAELLFPQSIWAPKAALMASYSYYMQNYYSEALTNLNRYLKTYPQDQNIAYAHYLVGICYYEMIEDEKRDTQPIINAKEKFELVIKDYPNTDFALDAKFKLDLIDETLASKEMYIGRYYLQQKKWISAINRFRTVVDQYDSTIYTEEALHRLVEIHYFIGLNDEAQKYANLLGYNFQSSEWYEKTYSVFNKKYEKNKKIIKNKDKSNSKLIKKIKSLFE